MSPRPGIRGGLGVLLAILPAATALAQEGELHGYVDYRFVLPAGERSFVDGGLGKTRFGDGDAKAQFGGAALDGTLQLSPSVLAEATLRYDSTDESRASLDQAFVRWRPVSTTPWRWSLKAGLFFPPISLENDGIAWTSRATLTPSAINSWVGEELRILGAEYRLEWRGERQGFELAGAVFGANDPAGEILDARGWSLSDLSYGVGTSVPEPDVVALELGEPVPRRYDPYVEIDHRYGWYAEATWRAPPNTHVSLLRYDNNGDPTTSTVYENAHTVFTWRTEFWSLAGETRFDDLRVCAQALSGETEIVPSPFFRTTTEFDSAYLLLSWERGVLRPAFRVDWFRTEERPSAGDGVRERGNALTFALNWRPRDWLRITGEVLRVDSFRNQREDIGRDADQVDTQTQLSARFLF